MGGVGWVSVECAPASAAGSSETSPKLYGLAVISGTVGRAIQKGGVPPFLQPLHVANYIRFLQISSDPFIQPHVSLSLEGNGVDDTMGSPVSLYEWGVGKGSWRRWESAFSLMLLGFPPQIHIPPASSRTVSPRGPPVSSPTPSSQDTSCALVLPGAQSLWGGMLALCRCVYVYIIVCVYMYQHR